MALPVLGLLLRKISAPPRRRSLRCGRSVLAPPRRRSLRCGRSIPAPPRRRSLRCGCFIPSRPRRRSLRCGCSIPAPPRCRFLLCYGPSAASFRDAEVTTAMGGHLPGLPLPRVRQHHPQPFGCVDCGFGLVATSLTSRQHHNQYFLSPSMRVVEIEINDQEVEDQRRKKRKSPLTSVLLFRSPLSRMLLSPQLRSPTARHGRSPMARSTDQEVVNDIDLNLEPIEHAPEIAQNVSAFGSDPHAHLDVENGSDTDTSAALQPQENVRRRAIVPDDGKIGCFPFVTYEPAKRSSANRPAGTMEMKPINSVNKDVIRAFMIEKVLPSIRAKWPPQDANKPIFIQQIEFS